MEHFQMARQETRIVDIGLPNKRGNTITRQKLRPACRRFAWVNSRLWSDYAQTGSKFHLPGKSGYRKSSLQYASGRLEGAWQTFTLIPDAVHEA